MHWRRKWQPTSVFLPGESQGQGSLVCFCLWGRRVGHDWSELAAAAAANLTLPHMFILTEITVKVLAYIPLFTWLNLVAPSAMTWLAPSSWDLWALQLSFQWQSDLLTFHTWIIINLHFKTKIQIENKMKCLSHPLGWRLSKRWTTAYVGKGVKKLESSYIASRNVKWCSWMENSLAVPQKVKHIVMTWPRNLLLSIQKICPHKILYMNVYSNIIHNSQTVETSQMSISW